MTVKELKELIEYTFDDPEYDNCQINVPINGANLDILGFLNHGHYTKSLGFDLNIG